MFCTFCVTIAPPSVSDPHPPYQSGVSLKAASRVAKRLNPQLCMFPCHPLPSPPPPTAYSEGCMLPPPKPCSLLLPCTHHQAISLFRSEQFPPPPPQHSAVLCGRGGSIELRSVPTSVNQTFLLSVGVLHLKIVNLDGSLALSGLPVPISAARCGVRKQCNASIIFHMQCVVSRVAEIPTSGCVG